MADEFLEPRQLRTLRPVSNGLLVGPPGCREAPAQIDDRRLRDIDAKWTDCVGSCCCVRLRAEHSGQFETKRAGACGGGKNLSAGRRRRICGHEKDSLLEGRQGLQRMGNPSAGVRSDTGHIGACRPSILANPYLAVCGTTQIGDCRLIPWYEWSVLLAAAYTCSAAPRGEYLSVAG